MGRGTDVMDKRRMDVGGSVVVEFLSTRLHYDYVH